MAGRFPSPYSNEVPREGSEKIMEYPPFDHMGIGARKSGTAPEASSGPKSIEHVGGTTGGKK